MSQYKNSSYLKYWSVNIRDFELNKNDMTYDELYFTKNLHVHSQKKWLPHEHPKQIKNKKTVTTTTTRSNCMVRVYKAVNTVKLSQKKKVNILILVS